MSNAEILSHYPQAKQAVSWCEMFLSPNEFNAREFWSELREFGFDGALRFIQDGITEDSPGLAGNVKLLARIQTETEDFRRYLAAKLGMV